MLRFRRTQDTRIQSEFSAIQSPGACKSWLATLVPLESPENLQRIGEFIGEIMESERGAESQYEIVDRVRVALFSALRDRVHDAEFRGTPLPTLETEPVWALIDTAEDLREAYELLITRLGDPQPRLVATNAFSGEGFPAQPSKVMALHRALDVNAHVLVLYQRLRVAIPDRIWDQHCRLGQLARQLEIQSDEIEDPLHASLTETCREAFNLPLLLALADPSVLGPSEFSAALACAQRWSGKVGFRIDSASELGAPPQKPSNNPGPVVPLANGEHQVRFDTHRVLRSIERRIALLEEGNPPYSLGLGEGISAPAARALLRGLLRRWGAIMPESIDFPEQVWRTSPAEFALAVLGLGLQTERKDNTTSAMGSANSAYEYVRMRDDAVTRSIEDTEKAHQEDLLEAAETWSVLGETPDSVLCSRRHTRPRLALGQLIGLKLGGKAGPTPFLLGWVQGLQQGISDDSHGVARPASTHLVRVKLLPGLPQRARAAVDQVDIEPVHLLVPNTAFNDLPMWDRVRAQTAGFTLILPLGTFRPARTLRVVVLGESAVVRLDELVNRGRDFDQVRFKMV